MSLRKKCYNPSDPRDAEELLKYLEEMSSDDEEYDQVKNCKQMDLVLLPPQDGQDSDVDDAPSDDEGKIHDIGKGVLKQPMEIVIVNEEEKNQIKLNVNEQDDNNEDNFDSSDSDDIPLSIKFNVKPTIKLTDARKAIITKNQKVLKKKRNWKEAKLQNRQERIKIIKTSEPSFVQKIRSEDLHPIDIFKTFFTEDFVQYICNESQKYAIFKGKHDFTVSTKEMYTYLGILILSGYSKIPFRIMFSETKSDAHNTLVSNSMSRDKFESIHRYLHFNDNNTIDPGKKIYKVEPLMNQINRVSQELAKPLSFSYSLDEAMEPYYGHHSMKQFIRGKPIRYGFKFWCLTTAEGYLLKFNAYCGSGDKIEGKTLGSSVTEKLCVGYLPPNSTVFIDNFFNSLSLLEEFKSNDINCIGTIRSDRVEKAPLRDLKKEKRGTSHVMNDPGNGLTLARWHDNSQVNIGTNINDSDVSLTKGLCRRWSKQLRRHIDVEQPTLINLYNQGMGGVDLFDKMRGLYRTRIRSRKWYWPFVRFCLNGAIVNMWILYRFVHPKTLLLEFIRRIVLSLLAAPEYLVEPKPKCCRNVLKEVRYDKIDHLIDKQPTQRRCAYCGKCTKFSCIKCNVGLHPDTCFRIYHTPPQ